MKNSYKTYIMYKCKFDYLGADGSLNQHIEPICATNRKDACRQAKIIASGFTKGTILRIALRDYS